MLPIEFSAALEELSNHTWLLSYRTGFHDFGRKKWQRASFASRQQAIEYATKLLHLELNKNTEEK